jgi:hypothetical protein
MPMQPLSFATEQTRQQVVHFVLTLTQGTRLEPRAPERQLLDEFVRGALTLEQVEACLGRMQE